MATRKDKENMGKIITTGLTAAVTVLGSVFLYFNNKDDSHNDLYKSTVEHAAEYQKENRALNEENARKTIKIIDLEIKLRELNQDKVSLISFLENIPSPVWIKRLGDDKVNFEMYILNTEYLEKYGIDKATYVGKTDYDFWPKETADTFKKEDFEVFLTGRSIIRMITIPSDDGKTSKRQLFLKFRVNLDNGEYGVGGMLLDTEER